MKKIQNFISKYWITVLFFVLIISGYKYLTDHAMLNGFLFPTVAEIGASFERYLPQMFLNLLYSFGLLIPGMFWGVLVALVVGIPMGLSGRIRVAIHPIIYSVSVVPAILISPFALNLAPSFRAASLFLVFYNAIWAELFATINGIMTIDKRYLDNAATLELKGIKKLVKVIIPAAMPSMASGFLTSLRGSFLVLVYAEMYGTQYGMGYFIKWNSDVGRFDHVWSGFIFMVIVLVILMQCIEKGKNYLLRWTIH